MITRAIQRGSNLHQINLAGQCVHFNKPITSWTISATDYPAITYSSDNFHIQKASLSDYLITWTISFHTGTVFYGFGSSFLFDVTYGDGEVCEGNFSNSICATDMSKGFKMLHIRRKSTTDILSFCILNNSPLMNDPVIPTPLNPLPLNLTSDMICNANICVMSI